MLCLRWLREASMVRKRSGGLRDHLVSVPFLRSSVAGFRLNTTRRLPDCSPLFRPRSYWKEVGNYQRPKPCCHDLTLVGTFGDVWRTSAEETLGIASCPAPAPALPLFFSFRAHHATPDQGCTSPTTRPSVLTGRFIVDGPHSQIKNIVGNWEHRGLVRIPPNGVWGRWSV